MGEQSKVEDPVQIHAEIEAIRSESQDNVPVFGHSARDFKLPCGYVDPDGKVHNDVVIEQMTGVEEGIMSNDDLIVTDRISGVLSSCCKRVGEIRDPKLIRAMIEDNDDLPEGALALTAADRMAMLLYLRIVSVGKTFRFDATCPTCKHVNKDESLDLNSLEIKYVKDPTKRRAKVKLPRSQVEVVLKILTGKGEQQVAALAGGKKNARTLALMARIETVGGKPLPHPSFGGIQVVDQMPYKDRMFLRSVFDLMEGAIDDEVEVTCKKAGCMRDFKFPLDLGQVFFSQPEETVTPDSIEWM